MKFLFYALTSDIDSNNTAANWKVVFATTEDSHPFGAIVNKLLSLINTSAMGIETSRQTIKIGRGPEKRIHRIHRVIHVAPKSYIKSNPESRRNIDWTHRFEVRGHWRKVDTIGKDREENYTVNGYTWVKHHTRGPDDLPLIKKLRVVDTAANNASDILASHASDIPN
jgi:hypothetical protein